MLIKCGVLTESGTKSRNKKGRSWEGGLGKKRGGGVLPGGKSREI